MKTLNFLIIALVLILFGQSISVNAQECSVIYSTGFEKPDLDFGDPQILEGFQPTQIRQVYIAAHIVRTSSGANGISTNNLNTAITQLNTAFSASMIEFILQSTDYIDDDNYTTVSQYNFPSLSQINLIANRLNIYFCPHGEGINGIAYSHGCREPFLDSGCSKTKTEIKSKMFVQKNNDYYPKLIQRQLCP